MKEIDICEYVNNRKEDDILIDVREKALFNTGTIKGAINIPINNIGELYLLPMDKDIYVFCQKGDISGEIADLLTDSGYNATNLSGGYIKYLRHILSADS